LSDNITLDPGAGGATVATDDDGTAHHQYVKLEFGPDNTQTKVTTSVGLPTDPLDRAARDMGKIDIAAFDVNLPGATVAHDDPDSGNPHKIGAKVETSPKGITPAADGDRTNAYADADGMLLVKLNTSNADVISERVSDTGGASTDFTNFSAVAATFNNVTAFHVFRTDAGTTPIYVDFRNGSAGAILWSVVIPPTGGANNPAYNGPFLFRTSAATALAYDVSAATTTVYISVSGFQSKV
jgi:hypothetical protein